VQDLRGLHHLAVGREHDRVGQTLADQLQAHQAIVDASECRPGKLDQVDLNFSGREIFLQRRD
jgi:hypothetical protein